MLWNDEIEKPLKMLRIVDLTSMLTGPYLTRLLVQYGADVIKVEKAPEGDPLRIAQESGVFECLNQGKRSIGLDLKRPEAIEAVCRLAAESDVFIENSREGVMDRLGLSYGTLSEKNPDLIYFSLRGFSGKHANLAGHDLNFIATSGVGEWYLKDGPNYSTFFGDLVGGVYVPLIKLLMHLTNPNRQGMHLVSNMDEGFRSLYFPQAFESYRQGEQKKEPTWLEKTFSGELPCSRYYKCRDGAWISLQPIQPKHWDTFCEVVDKAEWKPRREDGTLTAELEKLFQDAPATYWEALSSGKETCLFRVIPWQEHLQFSQARSQLSSDPLAWAGFSPNPGLRAAPKTGQDSFNILHSVGYSNKDISDLMNRGIVCQSL